MALEGLSENPRPDKSTKLTGFSDIYRVRVSRYRVVYQIDDGIKIIAVVAIKHRKDGYRGIKR